MYEQVIQHYTVVNAHNRINRRCSYQTMTMLMTMTKTIGIENKAQQANDASMGILST